MSAIDTNVISALWSNEPASEGTTELLFGARQQGGLVICAPVYAELMAYPGASKAWVDSFLSDTRIEVDVRLELEILLDVPFAPQQGRRQAVDKASRAIAQHLGDPASLNFYRHLTWQLLRLDQQGRGYFQTVCTMVTRVIADLREGFARKPGALLVARLKACGLWDEIREVSLPPGVSA